MRGYKTWIQAFKRNFVSCNWIDVAYEYAIRQDLNHAHVKFMMQAPVNQVIEINVRDKDTHVLDSIVSKYYNVV